MKLESLFKSENNKLFFLDGKELPVLGSLVMEGGECVLPGLCKGEDGSKAIRINVPWSLVGMDEENYNEEFLASFRDFLKDFEERKLFAFLVPIADVVPSSHEEKEMFVQSMKHCARRIKDCASVIGFAIPDEVDSEYFVEELSHKHKQYLYFSKNEDLLKDNCIVRF